MPDDLCTCNACREVRDAIRRRREARRLDAAIFGGLIAVTLLAIYVAAASIGA